MVLMESIKCILYLLCIINFILRWALHNQINISHLQPLSIISYDIASHPITKKLYPLNSLPTCTKKS